jgi:hypothetical protein
MSLVVSTIFLSACGDKNEEDDLIRKGFPSLVDTYCVPSTISFEKADKYAEQSYLIMKCGAVGKSYSYDAKNEQEKVAFEKYARSFGDTLADGNHYTVHNTVSVLPLVSVSVTADKQYDEKHPSNSLLNDLVCIDADRDFKYAIEYKLEHGKWCYGQDKLERSIDSISADNPVYMLSESFNLHFKKNPDTFGTYNLTINMKFGADPVTGETVEIDPIKVQMEFK